ncbi:unknown [Firmicutes bacterium CAG:791]|nr:unknown [Firmicutes bacterium CAG:791]
MKGLDEIIEEFKNSEESKALDKVNENTKKLLSRKEVMDAMTEVTAGAIDASFEEKDKRAAMIRASLEGYRLIEKLFPEEPAEKPELSALEELLFEQAHLAREKCKEVCSDIRYGRFLETQDLIRNAGLQEEYDAWKKEKGYE